MVSDKGGRLQCFIPWLVGHPFAMSALKPNACLLAIPVRRLTDARAEATLSGGLCLSAGELGKIARDRKPRSNAFKRIGDYPFTPLSGIFVNLNQNLENYIVD